MKRTLFILAILIIVVVLGIPLWVFNEYPRGQGTVLEREPVVRVLDTSTGKIIKLRLEEYLVGVVAAEMPADFATEALKAQAVTARTYTVKRMYSFGGKPSDRHSNAEICTDPTHCQAWAGYDELKLRWGGLRYYINVEKIKGALKATRGQIITYRNNVIEPVYHSSCGGKGTEDSGDVWAGEIPYLRSVECRSEYKVADHVYVTKLDNDEIVARIKKLGLSPLSEAGKAGISIRPISRSLRGRIKEAKVLGLNISGQQLRQILGLTSTLFTWEISGSTMTFRSVGKGHAVGLCQYGANGLALAGNDYRSIVFYYYTGVQLEKLKY